MVVSAKIREKVHNGSRGTVRVCPIKSAMIARFLAKGQYAGRPVGMRLPPGEIGSGRTGDFSPEPGHLRYGVGNSPQVSPTIFLETAGYP